MRNYARLVKLDAAPLLVKHELALPHPTPAGPQVPRSANIPFPTARTINWRKYAVAAIAVLVPLVVFEFYQRRCAATS